MSRRTSAAVTSRAFLLTLISRRSVKRSGLRYLRRGIDDDGHCANTVETEQILSSPNWWGSKIWSFVQLRGSIPLYFSQSPYSFKPTPVLHQSKAANLQALTRHFQNLQQKYGGVQVVLLVDKHGGESSIGQAYCDSVNKLNEDQQVPEVNMEWFDFHAECRGMKFENVNRLVEKLSAKLVSQGQTVFEDGKALVRQAGIIRTNCMDCLDRTNVAQSAFAQLALQNSLQEEGLTIDLLHDERTQWFNTLWADNGDAISRQYASTAALKGDFTRTRKRNYRGALNDLGLTLTRYYNNMVNDYFAQAVIDVLLGNVSSKAFDDFEDKMMSADPGISLEKIRQNAIATSSKIVIQESDGDLLHGWTMLTPAQPNTLRTFPFEECVVLLTQTALYCCAFDWNTEKVASFEKVDLRSISKVHYGTYITSTMTERQMNEHLNVGIVIVYTPEKGTTMRRNTRTLQNEMPAPEEGAATRERIDGGTGILSWLHPQMPVTTRTIALKVIPTPLDSDAGSGHFHRSPLAVAEGIASDIRRTMDNLRPQDDGGNSDLVEHGDIISLAEAKKRTGYLEQLGHSIKKFVWI